LYRTLDRVANNQYFSCGSIDNIDDSTSSVPFSCKTPSENNSGHNNTVTSKYNVLQCGINRLGSEDDEIDYEILLNDKDYDDILLVDNNENENDKAKSPPPRFPKESRDDKVTKRGRTIKHISKKTKRKSSLYRKTMMTAATVNENSEGSSSTEPPSETPTADDGATSTAAGATPVVAKHFQNTARFARGFADDAGRAIGNLMPTASLQSITARKYTLPDKTVASQVLMYRQLLHTKCRPGLKLSRPYQETPAQKAVMHMPWWEEGIEESKKMTISYDNLITRLWLNGAIEPYRQEAERAQQDSDILSFVGGETPAEAAAAQTLETHITDDGLPPVPHKFWVDRLGFQQPDPVTDFRSGGVLSLAMMVYMVESKPDICHRFFTGDTKVLPFGITCINVADMIAKFLMLAKSTDRMDALLSQKPFWKMFADPNAITAVQELAMSMLCDVTVELGKEKRIPYLAEQSNTNVGMPGNASDKVTVFDFSTILERTEKRVRDDLLGAGPKTVEELRSVEGRLRVKYRNQLERKIQRAKQKQENDGTSTGDQGTDGGDADSGIPASPQFKDAMDKASNFAGGLFAKVKGRLHHKETTTESAESATIVDLPPVDTPGDAAAASETTTTKVPAQAPTSGNSGTFSDGDWVGTDIAAATDGIMNFSIGDDDDDDADLL